MPIEPVSNAQESLWWLLVARQQQEHVRDDFAQVRHARDVDGYLAHVGHDLQESDICPRLRLGDEGAPVFDRGLQLGRTVGPAQHGVDDERPKHHGHAILVDDRRDSQLHTSLQDMLAASGAESGPVWRAKVEDGVQKTDLKRQRVGATLATTTLVDK
jgi:hypothetical protein